MGRAWLAKIILVEDVHTDKTKYVVMSRDRNAGRGHGVKIDNRSIERVEEFKYLSLKGRRAESVQIKIPCRKKLRAD
jgi:hypothetical protein